MRRKRIIKGNGEVISDAGGKPREDDVSDDKWNKYMEGMQVIHCNRGDLGWKLRVSAGFTNMEVIGRIV